MDAEALPRAILPSARPAPSGTLPGGGWAVPVDAAPIFIGSNVRSTQSPADLVPAGSVRFVHGFGDGRRPIFNPIRIDAGCSFNEKGECERRNPGKAVKVHRLGAGWLFILPFLGCALDDLHLRSRPHRRAALYYQGSTGLQ